MASTYNICHIISWVKLRNGHTLRPHYLPWVSQPARSPSACCCFECSRRLKQTWADTSHTPSSRSWLSSPCHLQAIVLVNVSLYQSCGILLLPATVTTLGYTWRLRMRMDVSHYPYRNLPQRLNSDSDQCHLRLCTCRLPYNIRQRSPPPKSQKDCARSTNVMRSRVSAAKTV